jgi:hypothetical protein
MLQLVIWILCVYLVVKGFEILSDPAQRNLLGYLGAAISWLAAPLFLVISLLAYAPPSSKNVDPTPPPSASDGQSFRDCLNNPNTTVC